MSRFEEGPDPEPRPPRPEEPREENEAILMTLGPLATCPRCGRLTIGGPLCGFCALLP